jgi:hypothetical protein
MSPISDTIVSASSSATPGTLISSRAQRERVIEVVNDAQQDRERVAADLWDPRLGELLDRARLA